MRKYGVENFEIKEIDEAVNFDHLVFLEGFYIKYYHSNESKYGYNLIIDTYGDGLEFISETTREKQSIATHHGKYIGRVQHETNIRLCIGTFETDDEAAIFVDRVNLYLRGKDFSKFNLPDKINDSYYDSGKELYELVTQNNRRYGLRKKLSSKYLGVSKHGQCSGWTYEIRLNKKRFRGYADTEMEAAISRDKLSVQLLGNKAKTNFPIKNYQKSS